MTDYLYINYLRRKVDKDFENRIDTYCFWDGLCFKGELK